MAHERRAAGASDPDTVRPCLWMSAGLVSYKLCDRDFDCDLCPFDSALRGGSRPVPALVDLAGAPVAALTFPEDRLYGTGHTWVRKEAAGARVRVGLDAFAVALIGAIRRVRPSRGSDGAAPGPLERPGASVLFEIDLDLGGVPGRLPVATPVAGTPSRWNRALEEDGAPVVRSPYGEGWIAELDLLPRPDPERSSEGNGALGHLVSSTTAVERSRLDLRRFRRRAAVYLFEDADRVGPTLPDGGEILTDLRYILGGPRYLELIADLLG